MCTRNIEYRLLKIEDFDEVWKILNEEYFILEPFAVAMGHSPQDCRTQYGHLLEAASFHNVSYGAFDNGQLIGINVCYLGRELKDNNSEDMSDFSLHIQQAEAFIHLLCRGNVADAVGIKEYLQALALCTKTEYGKCGIGTKLFRLAEEAAKREGCEKIFTIATSAFTQRITAKLGYRDIREIVYKDYIDPLTNMKIFENMQEPHIKAKLSVKDL